MNIRSFASIIPNHTPTTTENFLRHCDTVLEDHVANVVEDMHAPITHFARAGIPVPVPIIMPLVAEYFTVGSWAEPQVIVHRWIFR